MKHILAIASLGLAATASAQGDDQWHARARTMLETATNMPTVAGRGQVPALAQYFAQQFTAAGWPAADVEVMPYDATPTNKTAALIVRWRAAGTPAGKPILLMGHMDVVEAKPGDWTLDPFKFVEKDGYYYGRGVLDMKSGDVAIVTALLKLKAAGFKPKRDIIVFFTGDEETTGQGARLGATQWRSLVDAEYGLNADGGGGRFAADGHALGFTLQTAEKTYAMYSLTTHNKGGHSSKPRPDNAIYQLAHALDKLEAHRFTPLLNETTRAYFQGRQADEKSPLGDAMRAWLKDPNDGKAADLIEADPQEVGLTRTRCVATRLAAGHADNALPQLATATVNCRIMPGVSPDAVRAELQATVADPGVAVKRNDDYVASLASPLRPDVVAAYTAAVHKRHPKAPIIPEMSTGASDARPFRVAGIPVYGVDGAWIVAPEDERAHGRDERLPVKALSDDVDHFADLMTALAG